MPAVQRIHYQTGDVFAIVTDGLTDQLGGPTGKISYGYRRLERILASHYRSDSKEVIGAIQRDHAAWQGANARRDDLTAIVFTL